MNSNNSFVRNYIIIGIAVLAAIGIGYLLISNGETESNVNPEVVEKGFFNVEPEQEVVQTMFGEKVETRFLLSSEQQTATVTFDPMEDSSVGQHNITIVAKSQNTAKTFFMILDVVGMDEVQIDIENYNFEPHGLTIVQGTKVTWYNKDDVIHSVTAPDNMFDMDMQRQDYASFVFDEVGTFPYFCKPHPYMTGTITVISK